MLKVETKAPISPNFGEVAQTISHGNKPLTAKTAMINPQSKNQRLALGFIVCKTSALLLGLSTLVIVSNMKSPPTINKIDIISIKGNYKAK